MVADWADTINGKLYIQGAGWDRKVLPQDQQIEFGIAAGILVPWNLTNQQHQFSLSLETEDGAPVGTPITGAFNIGRPARSFPGQKLRTPLAARSRVKAPGLGGYRVALVVNNDVTKHVAFSLAREL
jgi:hypothetical protein